MKTRNLLVCMMLGLLLATQVQAQVGKEMKAFRNKSGVTVTLLTPAVYNLYKTANAGLTAEAVLRGIEEINVMQVRLEEAGKEEMQRVQDRFLPLLNDESKYTLVRSDEGEYGQERLYVSQRDEQVEALVLWSRDADTFSLVELKGKIDLNKVWQLAEVLNVKGLEKLAYVNAPLAAENGSVLDFTRGNMEDLFKALEERFGFSRDSISARDFFNKHRGMLDDMGDMFGGMEELFDRMGEGFSMGSMLGDMDGVESFSNGLQVIQENGKTRIKVDAKNVNVRYMIDGVAYAADSLTRDIPEDIANVMMVSDPNTPKTSYVVINTKEKAGEFISFSDGVLRYKYRNQEYTVNTEKLEEPALLVNNRLTREFTVDPSQIIQIRPVTEAERKLFRVPDAQVAIVTAGTMVFGF